MKTRRWGGNKNAPDEKQTVMGEKQQPMQIIETTKKKRKTSTDQSGAVLWPPSTWKTVDTCERFVSHRNFGICRIMC